MIVKLIDMQDNNIESVFAVNKDNKNILLLNKNLHPLKIGHIVKNNMRTVV